MHVPLALGACSPTGNLNSMSFSSVQYFRWLAVLFCFLREAQKHPATKATHIPKKRIRFMLLLLLFVFVLLHPSKRLRKVQMKEAILLCVDFFFVCCVFFSCSCRAARLSLWFRILLCFDVCGFPDARALFDARLLFERFQFLWHLCQHVAVCNHLICDFSARRRRSNLDRICSYAFCAREK